MPQMLPCSWLLVFLGSILFFLVIHSSWGTFFFLPSFPSHESSSYRLMSKKIFC